MSEPSDTTAPYTLMVDNDGLIRMDVIDILEATRFRTFEASDGDKAMALPARLHDLVVLLVANVQMPSSRNRFAVARETASRTSPSWSSPAKYAPSSTTCRRELASSAS